jgi:hypothetical protein
MSVRTYDNTEYLIYEQNIPGDIGGSVAFGTGILNTGVDVNGRETTAELFSPTDFGIKFLDDSQIPLLSVIAGVSFLYRLKKIDTAGASASTVRPFTYYNGGTGYLPNLSPVTTGFTNTTVAFGTAGDGSPFSLPIIFASVFGIQHNTTSPTTPADSFRQSKGNLIVTFSCPGPVAVTNAATLLARTKATLNGTITPNGATTAFPVSYQFQYGKTLTYGKVTPLTAGITGTPNVPVKALVTTLIPNTLYHFRLKATSPDGNISFGADMTFTTPVADDALMRF